MPDRYDVFLSHADHDREIAMWLKGDLEAIHGFRVWVYEGSTASGAYRTDTQEKVLQDGAAFVIVVSETAASSDEVKYEASRAFALRRSRIPVYQTPAIARNELVKGQLHVDQQNGVVLEAGRVSSAHTARVAEIVRADLYARGFAQPTHLPDGRIVLGRTPLIRQLLEEFRARRHRVVVLYGPPGAGKSTLARAVMLALRADSFSTASVFLSKDDRTEKDVLTRIQNAMELEADAGASKQIILQALAARVRALNGVHLLLDNFEQVSLSARDDLLVAFGAISSPPLTLILTTRKRFDTSHLSIADCLVDLAPIP